MWSIRNFQNGFMALDNIPNFFCGPPKKSLPSYILKVRFLIAKPWHVPTYFSIYDKKLLVICNVTYLCLSIWLLTSVGRNLAYSFEYLYSFGDKNLSHYLKCPLYTLLHVYTNGLGSRRFMLQEKNFEISFQNLAHSLKWAFDV